MYAATRKLAALSVALLILVTSPKFALGDDNLKPDDCIASDIEIVSPPVQSKSVSAAQKPTQATTTSPKNLLRIRLGESLFIRAKNNCVGYLSQEIKKAGSTTVLKLYMDDVAMPVIPTHTTSDNGQTMDLTFYLIRDSEKAENTTAWDQYFGKQSSGYEMRPRIALGIGTDIPRTLVFNGSGDFGFYITTQNQVFLWGVGGVLFVAVVLWQLGSRTNALKDYPNGPYSLGKSQMAFWGLLVFAAFAAIYALTGTVEQIPPKVLMLLGISGATGLVSIVIGSTKKAAADATLEEELAKLRIEQTEIEQAKINLAAGAALPAVTVTRLNDVTNMIAQLSAQPTPTGKASFLADICDDGNGVSFHRLQVVLWTLVLGVVFVYSIAQSISMPQFPDTLLMLLGISNGTYLGFKFPEKQ